MRSLNELLEAPSESHKILGFRGALEDDDQPASSYHLPIGRGSADILDDIDDRISSPSSGVHSKKVSKLLTYTGVRNCHFYRFEDELSKAHSLNRHLTELPGMSSF